MLNDYQPILINTPADYDEIELYFLHDIHKGSDCHDELKWKRIKADILSEPNRYVVVAGDCFENAIIGSKSDIYTQMPMPQGQKEWCIEQFADLRDRIICIVPGNHCARTTKTVGLYPLYDCALAAGLKDVYRQHFAFVDIGVGSGGHGKGKQTHYVGFVAHRMRDCKAYNGSDFVDGIDFAAYGHDHDAKDHCRAKLVYDASNKAVAVKNIEVIDSGSFLTYGGYGAEAGYRPQTDKSYKLILGGSRQKSITTVGFHI